MQLEQLMSKERLAETLIGTLDIEFQELTKERVVCTMPVGPKTHQPQIGRAHV